MSDQRQPDAMTGYAVGRAEPSDNRSERYWTGRQTFLTDLAAGLPRAVRFLKSLRTGSGTGLSPLDGTDGLVLSGGANAGFAFANRAAVNALTYGLWRRSGTNLILSSELGDLLTIDSASGQLAQNAYTAVSVFTNGWASFGGAYAPVGYRISVATGKVELCGMLMSGTVGLAAFTLPVGFRPPFQKRLDCDSNGAFGSVQFTTAGVVTPVVGSNVYMSLDGMRFDLA